MSRQTVFVVDDNLRLLRAVRDFLWDSGLNVETFESAREFLSAYAPEKSGCLVLDLRMPEMSGVELLETLRARGCKLPVLIVSGQSSVSEAARAMKLGPFEFLEKPSSPALLLARIREALKIANACR